jgi:glycerol kinase
MRTSSLVSELVKRFGSKDYFRSRCGLPLSTYFSALKLKWLIENVDPIKSAVLQKRALFGTVDSWLIWVRKQILDNQSFMSNDLSVLSHTHI